jgi:hypothetical protein
LPGQRSFVSPTEVELSIASFHLGQVPSLAMGMVYLSNADSIGLVMSNAVASQHNGRIIANASLSQALVLILSKGASGK